MAPAHLCIAAAAVLAGITSSRPALVQHRSYCRLRGGQDESRTEMRESNLTAASNDSGRPGSNAAANSATRPGRRFARGRAHARDRAESTGRGRHLSPSAAPEADAEVTEEASATEPPPSQLTQEVQSLIKELTLWTDPLRSATVLVAGNTLFALALFGPWTAPSIVGASIFWGVLISSISTLTGNVVLALGRQAAVEAPLQAIGTSIVAMLPPPLRPGGRLLEPEAAATAAHRAAVLLNDAFHALKIAATGRSKLSTLKTVGAALALKTLGAFVGALPLLWVCFVLAFAVPKARQLHGDKLDAAAAHVKEAVVEQLRAGRDFLQGQAEAYLPKAALERIGLRAQ